MQDDSRGCGCGNNGILGGMFGQNNGCCCDTEMLFFILIFLLLFTGFGRN